MKRGDCATQPWTAYLQDTGRGLQTEDPKELATRFFQLSSGHAMIAPSLRERFGCGLRPLLVVWIGKSDKRAPLQGVRYVEAGDDGVVEESG